MYSILAPGEDGSCWIVRGKRLYFRSCDSLDWTFIPLPATLGSIRHVSTASAEEGAFILDYESVLFSWKMGSSFDSPDNWKLLSETPKQLRFVSAGMGQELWGLTEENSVFRRVCSERFPDGRWIQLHGALLKSLSVASPEEVWGVDTQGRAYVWNRNEAHQELSEDVELQSSQEATQMSWQSLGNVLPLDTIHVNSHKIPWGMSEKDHGFIYKISCRRLLVVSVKSARKIWDDRGTKCGPYRVG